MLESRFPKAIWFDLMRRHNAQLLHRMALRGYWRKQNKSSGVDNVRSVALNSVSVKYTAGVFVTSSPWDVCKKNNDVSSLILLSCCQEEKQATSPLSFPPPSPYINIPVHLHLKYWNNSCCVPDTLAPPCWLWPPPPAQHDTHPASSAFELNE